MFEYGVDLVAVSIAVVVELDRLRGPAQLTGQLPEHEVLHERTNRGGLTGGTPRRDAGEMPGEARVVDDHLWRGDGPGGQVRSETIAATTRWCERRGKRS